jgi:hypothetical protein
MEDGIGIAGDELTVRPVSNLDGWLTSFINHRRHQRRRNISKDRMERLVASFVKNCGETELACLTLAHQRHQTL